MVLVLDIGNSFIKSAVFEKGRLIYSVKSLHGSFPAEEIKKFHINGCAITSVVPSATKSAISLIENDFGISPCIITNNSQFSLKIDYTTPETLGIDRLCGAEGAFIMLRDKGIQLLENDNLLTIDFGTATTLNLVKFPNLFKGGIIAPGIKMMFESLNRNTSQLPNVSFEDYKEIVGDSTNSSIASGVINSTCGLINRMREFLTAENKSGNIYTFITGGNAEAIKPFLGFDYYFEPNLILYGSLSVFNLNGMIK